MTEFTITIESIKSLIDEISPFSNKKNSISFVIGCDSGKKTKITKEEIPSTATIVRDGNMIIKGFYILGKEGIKRNFILNSDEFISTASELIKFEENIICVVSENSIKLSAGKHASISLQLLAETEPAIPFDMKRADLALIVNTDKFLTVAHKGCFLYNDSYQNNTADRVVLKISLKNDGILRGYSMDGYAIATASMSLKPEKKEIPKGYIIKPHWQFSLLKEKCETLSESERTKLNIDIKKAEEELANRNNIPLLELCENEKIDTSEYQFSLLHHSFELLKRVVKGTQDFKVVLTDNTCIVGTLTSTAIFTLGSTVPRIYDRLPEMLDMSVQAETVIDTQTFLKGLSVMLLHPELSGRNNKMEAVLMKAEENGISLNFGESKTIADYVEKSGNIGATNINMMATLFKKVISNMDNGNLYFAFYGEEKPLLIRNGSIKSNNEDFVFLLPVKSEKKDK